MNIEAKFAGLEVGYDVPAIPGMSEEEIQTPCLILDLDALERNIRKMGDYARAHNMHHRAHGKMHKSVDVLRLQQELGGAIGVCCQKVSEAEVFARAGIKDVLVSNQVRDRAKIDRLARLPRYGARITVCIDDLANVTDLSAAAQKHGTTVECLVEVDCGAGRCGVNTAAEVVGLGEGEGELKITVAYYYLPSGRLVHRKKDSKDWGVDPQIDTGKGYRLVGTPVARCSRLA